MAIDTREKRQSIVGLNMFFGPTPTSNASPDQEWRQEAGYGYSGILADNPSAPTTTMASSLMMMGAGY